MTLLYKKGITKINNIAKTKYKQKNLTNLLFRL